jgi:hypothetical protein
MNRTGAFLVLCALAALAACAQRLSPGSELTPAVVRAPVFDRAKSAHAPCTILSTLHSPVKGNPAIVVAFGELRMNSAQTRYAFPGVEYAYHGGKYVLAATAGKATYFANVTGLGPTIVVKTQAGVQTLYSGFAHPVKAFLHTPHRRVKAGQVIAIAGTQPLRFEYAPSSNVLAAGTQSNPCGSGSDSAGGTISVMPADVAVYARFHALSLDATPLPPVVYPTNSPFYPAGSPDAATPSNLTVGNVVVAHVVTGSVYEHSDVFSSYYVVLCGNVVFASGPARYRSFTYPNPTASPAMPLVTPSLPPLVFFRDAGELGKTLTAPLPAPYGRPCPAPAPANFYFFYSPVFNEVGQSKYVYYTASQPSPPATPVPDDTVTFSLSNSGVVTVNPVSPSPLPVFQYAPPGWPPPSPRADITAIGVGPVTITVTDASCPTCDGPISITVNPTPTPAEIPTPIPN